MWFRSTEGPWQVTAHAMYDFKPSVSVATRRGKTSVEGMAHCTMRGARSAGPRQLNGAVATRPTTLAVPTVASTANPATLAAAPTAVPVTVTTAHPPSSVLAVKIATHAAVRTKVVRGEVMAQKESCGGSVPYNVQSVLRQSQALQLNIGGKR